MNKIEIDTTDLNPTQTPTKKEQYPDLKVYVDGSCSPNPGGTMTGGVYIEFQGRKLWDATKVYLGNTGTNNMAEICIAIYGLQVLKRIQEKYPEYNVPSVIFSDSLLTVNSIENGRAKSPALDDKVDEFLKIRDAMQHKPQVVWHKREENSRADARSR